MFFLREISKRDVNKAIFWANGRPYLTADFIGRIIPQDVGKRVHLVGENVLQVENAEQFAARMGNKSNKKT